MKFAQKIYHNDKSLILATDSADYKGQHPEAANFHVLEGSTLRNFTQAVVLLDKPGTQGVIIEDSSEDALLAQLYAMYHPIDAAGGVVYNEDGAVLMIYRRGKWDLPKGKLDEGEKIEECAIREVSEETGLQRLSLTSKLCNTYHIYSQNNEQLLKCTAWYLMKGSLADKLSPQQEENILDARWVAEKDLAPLLTKTYAAIKEVMHKAGLKW